MKLLRRNIFFLLILKICYSEAANVRQGKLAGGHEAKPHSNPYVVSLQTRFLWIRSRHCMGSILNQRWILTAGHCVTNFLTRWISMDAIVGAHDLSTISSWQIYPLSNRIAHPMYRGDIGPYDIAMVKTYRNIEYSKEVQPISLPMINMDLESNKRMLLPGWGVLPSTNFFPVIPDKLQEVEVTYLPYKECYQAVDQFLEKYERNPLKEKANLCTGPITGGIAGCSGDSGGPLVQYVIDEETTIVTSSTRSSPMTIITNRPSSVTSGNTASPTPVSMDESSETESKTSTSSSNTESIVSPSETPTDQSSSILGTSLTMTTDTLSIISSGDNFDSSDLFLLNNSKSLRDGLKPTVVGVLSWGVVPCGDKGAPTVYSNVTNYMDFINKYLNTL